MENKQTGIQFQELSGIIYCTVIYDMPGWCFIFCDMEILTENMYYQ